ncbi:hypothetical protein BpHYR1_047783 [Brachionus plicatilis]|uniref:Uncharacterized protein n=1 Tax=Brachionus plicatilis TaxID=10195 RepID=A0A3M7T8I5_BRAPC|nr:hypothetical protein BpHYR1_047783 [Brachionus plicatilis]
MNQNDPLSVKKWKKGKKMGNKTKTKNGKIGSLENNFFNLDLSAFEKKLDFLKILKMRHSINKNKEQRRHYK